MVCPGRVRVRCIELHPMTLNPISHLPGVQENTAIHTAYREKIMKQPLKARRARDAREGGGGGVGGREY